MQNFAKLTISQPCKISQCCKIFCIAKLVPSFVNFLVLLFLPIIPLCNSCNFCYFVRVVWLEIQTQDFVKKKGQLIFIGTRGKLVRPEKIPIFEKKPKR